MNPVCQHFGRGVPTTFRRFHSGVLRVENGSRTESGPEVMHSQVNWPCWGRNDALTLSFHLSLESERDLSHWTPFAICRFLPINASLRPMRHCMALTREDGSDGIGD